MDKVSESPYQMIRNGGVGVHETARGLISVHGKEAVQFLDGLITNDVKTLADGEQMRAAFPTAQGRLLAVVRVTRRNDTVLFETEDACRQKLFDNLFRFTYAGDFFVHDLSQSYRYFSIVGDFDPGIQPFVSLASNLGTDHFVEIESVPGMLTALRDRGAEEISEELYETLRIESGIPIFGKDIDESTIVPEIGDEGLISYTKGCYIGQEIIARIHFRGHVAKRLTGLTAVSTVESNLAAGVELISKDGKNAGRITSVTFSPQLGRMIALGYVRYDHLAEGTELKADDVGLQVAKLPFIK
ncbi:MAG: glycine cleavage T C-terminal barrel domain-containing protein [Acidobacteriota bacterium]